MVRPASTLSPILIFQITLQSAGMIKSVLELNFIIPKRDPTLIESPGFNKQTIRLAIKPATCLTAKNGSRESWLAKTMVLHSLRSSELGLRTSRNSPLR